MDSRRNLVDHRRRSLRTTKFKVVLRITLMIGITVGFSYQMGFICGDYFKYPTTTHVSIVSALPVTTPPAVSIRINKPAKESQPIGEYFNHYVNDSTRVLHSYQRRGFSEDDDGHGRNDRRNNRTLVTFRRFYRERFYYVHIRTRDPTRYVPSNLFAFSKPLYHIVLETNIAIMATSNGQEGVQVYMSSYHDDMEGILRTPLMIRCSMDRIMCIFDLTFSVMVTTLAPPPYDTNCRDYNGSGYTSPDNCFSQCLTDYTSRHKMTLDSNVIWREKYENSSLKVLPWYLKYMKINGQVVTSDWIKKHEISRHVSDNRTERPSKEYINFYQRLFDILPFYRDRWTFCRQLCRRPSCYVETVIPQLIEISGSNGFGGINMTNLSVIAMAVYPPIDQVVTVTSEEKLNLLDFIVYILSSLSFWYGFCPLNAGNWFDKH